MIRKSVLYTFVGLVAAVIVQHLVVAQTEEKEGNVIKRVKPPTFTEDDTRGVFFTNVFTDGALVGERPANFGKPGGTGAGTGSPTEPGGSGDASDGGSFAWKEIIAAQTIEDEIKKISAHLDQTITTPTKFAGGGYKEARIDFSMLAMLFAIAGEYDGDVRWKKDAPELRDIFARAAQGAKVGSQQAYAQSKKNKEDLIELVRGTAFASVKAGDIKADWEAVGFRVPLMNRLKVALDERIKPAVANEAEFKGKTEMLAHEAYIVGAIGEVLGKEGMEEAGEEDYVVHAKDMKKAARDILEAIKLGNYANASGGAAQIDQACSKCHADWR